MPPAAHPAPMTERMVLAVALPAVAGAVNASGFLAVGAYTSHVTGHVARMGDALAEGRYGLAAASLSLVGAFLAGAVAASALVERAKKQWRALYAVPLLLEASLLATFALWVGDTSKNELETVSLLCAAMGLQNALVTRLSGAVIRTTHLTGIVTDIGIELVHRARAPLGRARGRSSVDDHDRARVAGRRLRLHGLVLGSFVFGTVAAPQLFARFGQRAMVGPCAALVALAVFDLVRGIHRDPHDGEGPTAMRPSQHSML